MSQQLFIKPIVTSPKKIKERLKQHGNYWQLLRDDEYDGDAAVLVGSLQEGSKYMRWFLKEEVEITYL